MRRLVFAIIFLCFNNVCVGFDIVKILNERGKDLEESYKGENCFEDLIEYVETLGGNGTTDKQWALMSK